MDTQLLNKNYGGWSRAVIDFKGELCISCSGAVTPDCDLEGNQLQVLHADIPLEALLFGITVTKDNGAAVFTWPDKQAAPRAFVNSLLKRDSDHLASFLVQFMFTFIENTFFSARWWECLSQAQRRHLAALAQIANPYYGNFDFVSSKIIPWEITNILLQ